MRYVKVDDIEQAEFWVPQYDKRFKKYGFLENLFRKLFDFNYNNDKYVTIGKYYKLFTSPWDGEPGVIYDDNGKDAALPMCHNGYYVKRNDT